MWHFIILYSIVLLLLFVGKRNNSVESVSYATIILLLGLFSGMRVGAGRDYLMYQNCYYDILNQSNYYFEKSWIVLSEACRCIGLGFNDYIYLIGQATVILMFYGAKRLRLDMFWFTIIYLMGTFGYVTSMNIMRQFFAISIIFAGLYNMFYGTKWRIIIYILVASIFHSSALILLIMYPISFFRVWTKYNSILFLIVTFVIGSYFFKPFFSLISHITPDRYALYFKESNFKTEASTGLYRYFLNASVFLYIILRNKFIDKKNNIVIISTNLVVIAVGIYNLLYNFNEGLRIVYYFIIFFFILVTYYQKKQLNTFYSMCCFVVFLGFITFGLKDLLDPQEPYFHFRTILEPYNYNNPWI